MIPQSVNNFGLRFRVKRKRISAEVFEFVSIRRGIKERNARRRYRQLFTRTFKQTLNTQQRKVATSFAPETLVIAGAGTGKTSVLLGRAKYLLTDRRSTEKKILLLAFNKNAAEEIRERATHMDLPIVSRTFHGFARDILKRSIMELASDSPSIFNTAESLEGISFSSEDKLLKFIQSWIEKTLKSKDSGHLLEFFLTLLVPYQKTEEFNTIEEMAQFMRSGLPRSLSGDFVKSHGEWLIANFLFANQVPFQYERQYVESKGSGLFYRPDFSLGDGIYVEYFGIDAKGRTLPWIDSKRYQEQITVKRNTHKKYGTQLIELTYQDLLDGILVEKLHNVLKWMEFDIKPISKAKILEAIKEFKYPSKLAKLLKVFLGFYRAQEMTPELLQARAQTPREIAFIKLFQIFMVEYQREIVESKHPDFPSLIIEATKILSETKDFLPFDHIMVDEFQDISSDRWKMLETIANTNNKIDFTFVGDDWQSINEFAGSDPRIMVKLGALTRKREQIFLDTTFRMPQSLCELSGEFAMLNPHQFPKLLKSEGQNATNPDSLYFHWDCGVEADLEMISKVIGRIGDDSKDQLAELKILARYSWQLPNLKDIERLWAGPVTISTVHKSKGSEADYVIILGVNSDYHGFPSLIQDDPLLNLVRTKDSSFLHATERRVFYVAITRARKATHVMSSISAPSAFALEFIQDKRVTHFGLSSTQNCPFCSSGFLVQLEGRRGLVCSNRPACEFRTPSCGTCNRPMNLARQWKHKYSCKEHGTSGIKNCKVCEWGVLELRIFHDESFLACHLWQATGCAYKETLGKTTTVNTNTVATPNFLVKPSASALSRKGKHWSVDEEQFVLTALSSGILVGDIAHRIGRAESAVKGRVVGWLEADYPELQENRSRVNIEIDRTGLTWERSETQSLIEGWLAGVGICDIAESLGRSKFDLIWRLFETRQIKLSLNSPGLLMNKLSSDGR